jgi:WD40 repeat protein
LRSTGVNGNTVSAVEICREHGGRIDRFRLEHPQGILFAAFVRQDAFLVTHSADQRIRYWRMIDGALERTIEVTGLTGHLAAVNPEGTLAVWHDFSAAASPHGNVFWLDLASGRPIGASEPLAYPLKGAQFSPDGRLVALSDGPVTILDSRTRQVLSSSIRHSAALSEVNWAPDGQRLLTSGFGWETLVWDARTGTQVFGPLGFPHGSSTRVAQWSADGRFIVTAGDEAIARLWDATTGEAITPLLKHSGLIRLAFMAPNDRLITFSDPNLLRVWELRETLWPTDVLMDFARLVSGRRLDKSGFLIYLKPAEVAALDHSLRDRAPQLFE